VSLRIRHWIHFVFDTGVTWSDTLCEQSKSTDDRDWKLKRIWQYAESVVQGSEDELEVARI